MLQKFMNMGVFIYTMAGIGTAGILVMLLMNAFSRKKIRDKSTYTRAANRMKKVTAVASIVCLLVAAASMGTAFYTGQIRNVGIRNLITGAGSIFAMLCFGKLLSYINRQRLFQEYFFEQIDRQNGICVQSEVLSETASAGVSRSEKKRAEHGTRKRFFMKKNEAKKTAAAAMTPRSRTVGDFAEKNAAAGKMFGKNGLTGKNGPENAAAAEAASEKPLTLYTKDQLVDRAMKGIRESAASGENKFSHMLSDEEEDIMREVIGEFITQGQA